MFCEIHVAPSESHSYILESEVKLSQQDKLLLNRLNVKIEMLALTIWQKQVGTVYCQNMSEQLAGQTVQNKWEVWEKRQECE